MDLTPVSFHYHNVQFYWKVLGFLILGLTHNATVGLAAWNSATYYNKDRQIYFYIDSLSGVKIHILHHIPLQIYTCDGDWFPYSDSNVGRMEILESTK